MINQTTELAEKSLNQIKQLKETREKKEQKCRFLQENSIWGNVKEEKKHFNNNLQTWGGTSCDTEKSHSSAYQMPSYDGRQPPTPALHPSHLLNKPAGGKNGGDSSADTMISFQREHQKRHHGVSGTPSPQAPDPKGSSELSPLITAHQSFDTMSSLTRPQPFCMHQYRVVQYLN